MKSRVIVAAIFVPLLFVVLFFVPPGGTAILVGLICAAASYELVKSSGTQKNKRIYLYTSLCALAIPLGTWLLDGSKVFFGAVFLLMALLFIESIEAFGTEKQISVPAVMLALFAGGLMPYFLSSLVSLRCMENGRLLVLIPFIVAFTSDGGAYFAGVFFGKHKAVPRVSPKKTVEGYVGGIVCGVLCMAIYGVILLICGLKPNMWSFILYGLIGAFITEVGDLAFSLIKRDFGVKDYGNLLPGHGGVMDRFDSMVFAAPVIYLLVVLLPDIGA